MKYSFDTSRTEMMDRLEFIDEYEAICYIKYLEGRSKWLTRLRNKMIKTGLTESDLTEAMILEK